MARIPSLNIHGVDRPLKARIGSGGSAFWLTLHCGPAPEPDVTFFFHPSLLPYFNSLAAAINGLETPDAEA